MKVLKYLLFTVVFCIFSQNVFADGADLCAAPADCETAMACGILQNFKTADDDIHKMIADAILVNFSVCEKFNYEHGHNDFSFAGKTISWRKIKELVLHNINSNPKYTIYTFLVTENALYKLGGSGTGAVIGGIVVVAAVACVVASGGICGGVVVGGVGASAATAAAITAGTTATVAGTTLGGAAVIGAGVVGAGGVITGAASDGIQGSSGVDIKQTWSNWDGCVNITANGATTDRSDMFTRYIMGAVFPDDYNATFAFNKSRYNLLFKNGSPLILNEEQKNKVMSLIPTIADKGRCDSHVWKLYLYPLRMIARDVDTKGMLIFDIEAFGDPAIIDK